MHWKLGKVCLTAVGLVSGVAAFAYEAPVVDVQQQQQQQSDAAAVSTQGESTTGGSWQPVSSNASDASSTNSDGWQPVNADNNASYAQPSSPAVVPAPSGTLNQRVDRLEQQVTNYSQMNLPQQITDLQQKVSQLQGQLEVDQHTIKTLTDQQKLYYQDVEQQIAQLKPSDKKTQLTQLSDNAGNNGADSADTTKVASTPAPHDEASNDATAENKNNKLAATNDATQVSDQPASTATNDQSDHPTSINLLSKKKLPSLSDADSYEKAFRSLSNKHFDAAQTEFQQYLQGYPKGRFAVNAHFWLGEIALMHESYDVAEKQFQTVVTQYPTSVKVSDAKLKIAMIHAATGKMNLARTEFLQIRKEYPGSTAAQLASIRLQQLANATSVSVQ